MLLSHLPLFSEQVLFLLCCSFPEEGNNYKESTGHAFFCWILHLQPGHPCMLLLPMNDFKVCEWKWFSSEVEPHAEIHASTHPMNLTRSLGFSTCVLFPLTLPLYSYCSCCRRTWHKPLMFGIVVLHFAGGSSNVNLGKALMTQPCHP